MLVFKCDICETVEDHKRAVFKLPNRDDICAGCLKSLDKCADLLRQPGFVDQLDELHGHFYPDGVDEGL